MQGVGFDDVAEMTQQNSDEENKRHSKRYPKDFYFSQVYAGEYHEGIEQNCACQRDIIRLQEFY